MQQEVFNQNGVGFIPDVDKIPLIVVLGPTASGKTKTAVSIAKKYNGEVVSADSMQLYKEMSIGTAKPTLEEMQGIRHHLIDVFDLSEECSVASYAALAHEAIADIYKRGKLPILAGGTGLYINAVADDMSFSENEGQDKALRGELEGIFEKNGIDFIFSMLCELDPVEAKVIDRFNPSRVIRAIEICKITGGSVADYKARNIQKKSRYFPLKLGLDFESRARLYERIDRRVDTMLENGLLEEAKRVLAAGSKTAQQAIGYKELVGYFSGLETLETAILKIKQESRRYGKRQLTWFRRDNSINRFYLDSEQNKGFGEAEKNIFKVIDNYLKIW